MKRPYDDEIVKYKKKQKTSNNYRPSVMKRSLTYKNEELKYFDKTLSFNFDNIMEIPATGQLVPINQGAEQDDRIGRKIVVKSLLIKGTLLYTPTLGTEPETTCYLYVVLDRQTNGAAAAITDIFTSTAGNTALPVVANNKRFKVIKAMMFDLPLISSSTSNVSPPVQVAMQYYKKLNVEIDYADTGSAIGSITSNNLFLVAGSVGADDKVAFSGAARIRFIG